MRKANKGWRLDYILTRKMDMPLVKTSYILERKMGSAHAPMHFIIDLGKERLDAPKVTMQKKEKELEKEEE